MSATETTTTTTIQQAEPVLPLKAQPEIDPHNDSQPAPASQGQTAQATLHSPRLTFVPYADEHYPLSKALDQDPEVMKHIGFGRPLTDDETRQVHEWLLKSGTYLPGRGTWVAYAEGQAIGWWILAATPRDPEKPTEDFDPTRSETGYRLLKEFWGKGYATEGSKEMIRHGLEDLGLQEVFGETMTVNHASRKVMAKCGMKHTDTWFNTYPTPPPGIEEGEVRYRITRGEWREQEEQAKERGERGKEQGKYQGTEQGTESWFPSLPSMCILQ
ncbi:GNAT domain-containing protein [Aspergillus unguis]